MEVINCNVKRGWGCVWFRFVWNSIEKYENLNCGKIFKEYKMKIFWNILKIYSVYNIKIRDLLIQTAINFFNFPRKKIRLCTLLLFKEKRYLLTSLDIVTRFKNLDTVVLLLHRLTLNKKTMVNKNIPSTLQ